MDYENLNSIYVSTKKLYEYMNFQLPENKKNLSNLASISENNSNFMVIKYLQEKNLLHKTRKCRK